MVLENIAVGSQKTSTIIGIFIANVYLSVDVIGLVPLVSLFNRVLVAGQLGGPKETNTLLRVHL